MSFCVIMNKMSPSKSTSKCIWIILINFCLSYYLPTSLLWQASCVGFSARRESLWWPEILAVLAPHPHCDTVLVSPLLCTVRLYCIATRYIMYPVDLPVWIRSRCARHCREARPCLYENIGHGAMMPVDIPNANLVLVIKVMRKRSIFLGLFYTEYTSRQ